MRGTAAADLDRFDGGGNRLTEEGREAVSGDEANAR